VHPDAAQKHPGDEAAEIGDGASPDGDDQIAALQTGGDETPAHLLGDRKRLGRIPVRDLDHDGTTTRRGQPMGDRRRHPGLGDVGDAARCGVGAHQGGIGPAADPHPRDPAYDQFSHAATTASATAPGAAPAGTTA
jgi:hypothetical protein